MSVFFSINSWGCTAKKGFTFHPDVIKEVFAWQFLSHDLKQFKVVDYQSNPGKPFFLNFDFFYQIFFYELFFSSSKVFDFDFNCFNFPKMNKLFKSTETEQVY